MCGIAGLSLREGMADRATLDAFGAALAHRGPDGRGALVDGPVALAHTRLSIIDLASGSQPLYNEDGSIALVCNGEIYNFVELRRELEALGHRFATHSDSETLIHAYEAWGHDCLSRLHGMFAFALYDRRDQSLFIARDRLGIKPLFLLHDETGLYFASELKALLGHLPGKPRVHAPALLEYLQNQYTSGESTLIEGITRLAPGKALVVSAGAIVKHWHYYRLPLGIKTNESHPALLDRFDALMNDIMLEHTRSDVPFGLFLSGGIDSALLAMLLQRRDGEPLRSFSVGFDTPQVHNELALAQAIAQRFGTVHTALTVTPQELLARLPFSVWSADELLGDTACLPTSLLAERAGRELKVVFSGEGGDEVFAGYARYRASAWKRLLRRLRAPGMGGMRSRGQAQEFEPLFAPALRGLGDVWQAPQACAWKDSARAMSTVRRMQATDIATWLPDDLLVKCDRMLMSFGVEGRVPYLDHRIVEFGLSLPDSAKVSNKFGKLFLRRWGQCHIPGEHMWLRKKGFTVPIAQCLTRPVLEKLMVLLPFHAGVRQWFDPPAVHRLVERVIGGHGGARMVWSLLQFAVWHNIFIDGNAVRPAADTGDIASLL